VVLLSSLAAGIGSSSHTGLCGLAVGGLIALIACSVWAFLTSTIGAKLFPVSQTSVRHLEVWRPLGFASAPGILRVFGAAPVTGVSFLLPADIIAGCCGRDGLYQYGPRLVCACRLVVHVFLLLFLLSCWGGINTGFCYFSV
jgi:hypothetical protein